MRYSYAPRVNKYRSRQSNNISLVDDNASYNSRPASVHERLYLGGKVMNEKKKFIKMLLAEQEEPSPYVNEISRMIDEMNGGSRQGRSLSRHEKLYKEGQEREKRLKLKREKS